MRNTEAFELYKSGYFVEALKLSVDSINNRKSRIHETPYEQCKLVISYWMKLNGLKRQSYNEIINLMKIGLDSAEIRASLLTLLGNQSDKNLFIFGLGTGRSGSTSLTSYLSSIPGSYFSHEHPSIVPWHGGEDVVDWHLTRMAKLSSHYSIVGDVSHWWLPYIEYINCKLPNSYFVVTRRTKQATVESFLKIKGGGGRGSINHWIKHDGAYYKKNFWDKCYPKFSDELTLKGAIEKYWDYYSDEAERLQLLLPNNVVVINIEDPKKEERISNFLMSTCKVSPEKNLMNVKNQGNIKDGMNMFPTPEYLTDEYKL